MGGVILDFRFSILDSPPPIQNPKSAQPQPRRKADEPQAQKREADQPRAKIENGGGVIAKPSSKST
jgi:hypothetical protein